MVTTCDHSFDMVICYIFICYSDFDYDGENTEGRHSISKRKVYKMNKFRILEEFNFQMPLIDLIVLNLNEYDNRSGTLHNRYMIIQISGVNKLQISLHFTFHGT